MLVSASTVKDTVANLERFVRRNRAAGIDHLILFLDADQPEVEAAFAGSAAVTCVRAWGPGWWGEHHPAGLNKRQNLNAGLANAVLTRSPWAEWLFHVDADEVVHLDRDRLEGLDRAIPVVHLEVLEAVSDPDAVAEGGWFKRLLVRPEREVLLERGLIPRLPNQAYFHGHVGGKSGWRPSLGLRAGVHKPQDLSGATLTGVSAGRVLHLESTTAQEFARKWRNLVAAGLDTMNVRGERRLIAGAVVEVVGRGLDEAATEAALHDLWRRTTRDPFPELRALGYLERIDVDAARFEPRPIPEGDLAAMRRLLAAAGGVDRRGLHGPHPERVLDRVVAAARMEP